MPILNYTTTISAGRTVGEIQEMLAKHGAKSILLDFEGGLPTAICFLIATPFGERGFRLPANIDAVFAVMTRQYQRRQIERRYATHEQAARVGWRIIKD